MTDKEQIHNALKTVVDPHLDNDLVSAKAIKNISIDDGAVSIDIVMGYPADSWHDELKSSINEAVGKLDGVNGISANVRLDVSPHTAQKGVTAISGVKNIIAVASGKGGVGKSTVSVNLALALVAEGARVGILDADIYGPSQPRMLGISGKPESKDGKSLEPLKSFGLQAMSIGFLIDEETPMIWRGPMVTQALEQLLNDTRWDDLDYLIVDLPPGTGDIQLTLAQKVPVTGSIIVTTPQDIALLDARKAFKMFEKVEIPVLGVVENMSTHICSQCGHEEHIFGEGGGQRMADEYGIDYLGSVPLNTRIRADVDHGQPTLISDPDGAVSDVFKTIARKASAKLSARKKDHSASFPSIVIQNT